MKYQCTINQYKKNFTYITKKQRITIVDDNKNNIFNCLLKKRVNKEFKSFYESLITGDFTDNSDFNNEFKKCIMKEFDFQTEEQWNKLTTLLIEKEPQCFLHLEIDFYKNQKDNLMFKFETFIDLVGEKGELFNSEEISKYIEEDYSFFPELI